MNQPPEVLMDLHRKDRIGLDEAVLCESKSVAQINQILENAVLENRPLLLTRLDSEQFEQLDHQIRQHVNFDTVSRTGIAGGALVEKQSDNCVAIVAAGTSDIRVAKEAGRTLDYHGVSYEQYNDVGVAGLWRVMAIEQKLREQSVVIVVAGMDAALPTVVAGLVPALVVAVPTSVGYGVAKGGHAALNTVLSSCAPGVVTVNIDNGYGAACAAIRALKS